MGSNLKNGLFSRFSKRGGGRIQPITKIFEGVGGLGNFWKMSKRKLFCLLDTYYLTGLV